MKRLYIRGIEAIGDSHTGAVVTVGNFDGVHLGHQKIISNVTTLAAELSAPSMAITFDPHPIKCIAPDRAPKLLMDTEAKVRMLRHYGIDKVLVIEFNRQFAHMPPEGFVHDILVNRLEVRAVVVGSGYNFGKARRGTTDFLRRQGRKYGFGVRVVRNARAIDKVVSSTRIRVVLGNGNALKATELLGRPYAIRGTVITGAGRGKNILKTPTANFTTQAEVIPRDGVYAVRVRLGGRLFDGVANLGNNPTFHGAARSYEVHLLDFSSDVVGDEIEVRFIDRIRGEEKFPSPEALRAQIQLDIQHARAVLAATPPWR